MGQPVVFSVQIRRRQKSPMGSRLRNIRKHRFHDEKEPVRKRPLPQQSWCTWSLERSRCGAPRFQSSASPPPRLRRTISIAASSLADFEAGKIESGTTQACQARSHDQGFTHTRLHKTTAHHSVKPHIRDTSTHTRTPRGAWTTWCSQV